MIQFDPAIQAGYSHSFRGWVRHSCRRCAQRHQPHLRQRAIQNLEAVTTCFNYDLPESKQVSRDSSDEQIRVDNVGGLMAVFAIANVKAPLAYGVMNHVFQQIDAQVNSQQGELVNFVKRLVQTPSLPGLERQAQAIVASKLRDIGLQVAIERSKLEELTSHPAFCDDGVPFNDRINVIGRWYGQRKNGNNNRNTRSLILNGHIDVVPVGNESLWSDSPWSGRIEDGKLYGRGSCDMKAGLSAAIFAVDALKKLGFAPEKDVLIESVIGEETGGVGTLTAILKNYAADAAIIMEPTRLRMCPVQSGALTFRLVVHGRAVHASVNKSGVSAIEKFYYLLKAAQEFERRRHLTYSHSLYQDPMQIAPLNFGTISGGEWHSTVPNELIVEGRYGVLPGESNETAKRAFSEMLRVTSEQDQWLKEHPPILEWIEGQYESGETDLGDPILKALGQSHQIVIATEPKAEGVSYGSDLRLFTNYAKIPTVLYGPGDVNNAHMVDEFIRIQEIVACTKVLALTIYQWCQGGISSSD